MIRSDSLDEPTTYKTNVLLLSECTRLVLSLLNYIGDYDFSLNIIELLNRDILRLIDNMNIKQEKIFTSEFIQKLENRYKTTYHKDIPTTNPFEDIYVLHAMLERLNIILSMVHDVEKDEGAQNIIIESIRTIVYGLYYSFYSERESAFKVMDDLIKSISKITQK